LLIGPLIRTAVRESQNSIEALSPNASLAFSDLMLFGMSWSLVRRNWEERMAEAIRERR
jgi:hypothetical protein